MIVGFGDIGWNILLSLFKLSFHNLPPFFVIKTHVSLKARFSIFSLPMSFRYCLASDFR